MRFKNSEPGQDESNINYDIQNYQPFVNLRKFSDIDNNL